MEYPVVDFHSFVILLDSEKSAMELGRKLARSTIGTPEGQETRHLPHDPKLAAVEGSLISMAIPSALAEFDKVSDEELWSKMGEGYKDISLDYFHGIPVKSTVSLETKDSQVKLNFYTSYRSWESYVDYVMGEGSAKKYKVECLNKSLEELK